MSLAPGSKILLALGGGAARGVAHIGVIRTLEAAGFEIAGVAGTSIGSVFGGMYCAGALDGAEEFARSLGRRGLMRLLDPVMPRSGLLAGERFVELLRELTSGARVEELGVPFCAVATDLASGAEVRLRRGELAQAIRASSGIPGLFQPFCGAEFGDDFRDAWLVDGIVASPVPVLAVRELGDFPIVAVNVNQLFPERAIDSRSRGRARMAAWFARLGKSAGNAPVQPGMVESLYSSHLMLQNNLAGAQFQIEPPALLIEPNMSGVNLFDFHLSDALIEEGARATRAALEGA